MKRLLVITCALICSLCSFLPIFLNLKVTTNKNGISDYGNPRTVKSFTNIGLKLTLISNIALAIPILLEIFRDGMILKTLLLSYNIASSNLLLIFSIILPDIVILFYAFPYKDLTAYLCLTQLRSVLVITAITLYLLQFGNAFWKKSGVVMSCIMTILGLTGYMLTEFSSAVSLAFWLLGLSVLLGAAGIVIYLMYGLAWLRNVYRSHRHGRSLCAEEYCSTIYVLGSLFLCVGLILSFVSYGSPTMADCPPGNLILYNLVYGIFFTGISVFQGGLARREEIIKVRFY